MTIVLYGGFIRVVISLGAKPLTFTMSRGPRLDDGEWHHVEVRQELKVLTYTLINFRGRDLLRHLIILPITAIVHNLINKSEQEANKVFKINAYNKGPIARSIQLPHIPVTTFSQTDLFLV